MCAETTELNEKEKKLLEDYRNSPKNIQEIVDKTLALNKKIIQFKPRTQKQSKKLVDNQIKIMYHMFCSKKNKTSTFSSVGRAVDS